MFKKGEISLSKLNFKESDILFNQRIIYKTLIKLSSQEVLEIDKQVSTVLECEWVQL